MSAWPGPAETRRVRRLFWFSGLLLGCLQVWPDRFAISSEDGIAYLDVADAFLRADWRHVLTGYWSPLYPCIQGAAAWLARPSPYWEFPLVNLVDLLIFLGAMGAFDWLLCEFQRSRDAATTEPGAGAPRIPGWIWATAGYALFLWSALTWTTIRSDTPDMLTAALLYASGALILRIRRAPSVATHSALGAALGLGCLSKAALFPASPVLLLVALLQTRSWRTASWRPLLVPLVFLLIVGPYVWALSWSLGHLTFGESGRLNYAWLVNPGRYRIPDTHWQGGPAGFGEPLHRSHVIADEPATFEFSSPLEGTYPPWTDPSFWYQGLELRFDPVAQLRVVARNLEFYSVRFLMALFFGFGILAALDGRAAVAARNLVRGWPLLVPGLAGLGIYLIGTDLPLVHFAEQPSMRLVAPFAVLLCVGTFLCIRVPGDPIARRVLATAAVAFAAVIGVRLGLDAAWSALHALRGTEHTQWQVAHALDELGVEAGAPVAVANDAIAHVSWARLGRWKIVVETRAGSGLWSLDEGAQHQFLAAVQRAGARAIVVSSEKVAPPADWQPLEPTSYHVRLLPDER